MNKDNQIEQLIYIFSKIPGLGPRSARRAVLHLLRHKDSLMRQMAISLEATANAIKFCDTCGNMDTSSPCSICIKHDRDKTTICVVESIADLWAIERSNIYSGLYHVLGGTLSAVNGRTADDLNIDSLVRRIKENNISEIILATNATMEGQTTAFYITEILAEFNLNLSRLACGLPIGGELDYLDEGTLSAALSARKAFK